jgi:hypothetical protein
MRGKLGLATAATILVFSLSAYAKNEGKLPPGAKPLDEAAIKTLYADMTINYKDGPSYFFSPDMRLVGFKAGWEAFADGDWVITGNEMCWNAVWHDKDKEKSKPYSNCHKYYSSKAVVYIENTKTDDQWMGDVYRYDKGEKPKMVKGDTVSKKVEAMKAKLGY